MLPLFGRSRKSPVIAGFDEEWIVPNDQELYGKSKTSGQSRTAHLKTVEEVSNEASIINSEASIINNEASIINNDASVIATADSYATLDQIIMTASLNIKRSIETDSDFVFSDITTNETTEYFADETFSVMDEQECELIDEIANVDSVEIEVIDSEIEDFNESAVDSLLIRISEMERKIEVLYSKVTKLELSTQIGNNNATCDSNSSIFVNEIINVVQDVMKTGISYQQKVVGKFIDEFDEMFDFDFNDFDPLK